MTDLRSITDKLFQQDKAPIGDDKERKTFFDYDTIPLETREGKPVRLVVKGSARVPDYGKARTRNTIYIPDKLKENMKVALGVDSNDEFRMQATLIALADYALKVIAEQDQTIVVRKADSGR